MYTNDSDDYLPPTNLRMRPNNGGESIMYIDMGSFDKTLSNEPDIYAWFCYNPLLPGAPIDWRSYASKDSAALNTTVGTASGDESWHKILSCPSCPTSERIPGNIGYQVSIGFSYCKYLLDKCPSATLKAGNRNKSASWRRISSIKAPGIYVCVFDGTNVTAWGKWLAMTPFMMGASETNRMRYCRHSLALNSSFADGHVESIGMAKFNSNSSTSYAYQTYTWYAGSGLTRLYGGDADL